MSQAQLDPTIKHNKETTGEFGKKKKILKLLENKAIGGNVTYNHKTSTNTI
jgi:hypothetical protein